jgi:hypothetical protein
VGKSNVDECLISKDLFSRSIGMKFAEDEPWLPETPAPHIRYGMPGFLASENYPLQKIF